MEWADGTEVSKTKAYHRQNRLRDIGKMHTGVKCINCKKEFNLFISKDSEKCDDCYDESEKDTKIVPAGFEGQQIRGKDGFIYKSKPFQTQTPKGRNE